MFRIEHAELPSPVSNTELVPIRVQDSSLDLISQILTVDRLSVGISELDSGETLDTKSGVEFVTNRPVFHLESSPVQTLVLVGNSE